jgi:glutamate dehydrogenase
MFRENFVLAHTQHFKNKDIYEGGSKLVMLMDASALDQEERPQVTLRLYKLQRADDQRVPRHLRHRGRRREDTPNVVDYYREEEPIELGPDENMHDSHDRSGSRRSPSVAATSSASGDVVQEVGINHKEYGVTSTGVVKFAELTMSGPRRRHAQASLQREVHGRAER